MAIEIQTLIFTDGTQYRLKPNPDAPVGEGYKNGAVLEWKDETANAKWTGYFFIAPEALADFASVFAEAAKDVK